MTLSLYNTTGIAVLARSLRFAAHRFTSAAALLTRTVCTWARSPCIHRFGSSLNTHVHFHVCVVDGVFEAVAAPLARSVDTGVGD